MESLEPAAMFLYVVPMSMARTMGDPGLDAQLAKYSGIPNGELELLLPSGQTVFNGATVFLRRSRRARIADSRAVGHLNWSSEMGCWLGIIGEAREVEAKRRPAAERNFILKRRE